MDEDLIVMSLFDGMSCGQIALKENGFKVKTFYASEIDKFAIQVTQSNFPNTQQLGNILNWRSWDIDWKTINLILAGSPCQGFSFAGKQLNFNDERSKLFFVFVDILNHVKKVNPDVKFLLENVIMKKEYQKVINDMLGIFPVRINSNLVSAQNRDRLYWSNIKIKMVGLFNEIHTDIEQPKDRGILLKDILQPESEVNEKYYLSDKMITWLNKHSLKRGVKVKKLDGNQKTSCLTATAEVKQNLTTDYICVSMVGRKLDKNGTRKDNDKNIKAVQQLEPNTNNKTNCLISVQKDNLLLVNEATKKGYTEIKPGECVDLQQINSKTRRGRKMINKSNCLQTSKTEFYKYLENFKLRRLTPLECERLQTVPENYTNSVSDTQRYKMLGNGWTIEVIKHILKHL